MSPDAAAQAATLLRGLATRVRRNVPLASDPERFHEEASEIAGNLVALAEQLSRSDVASRRGRDDPTKGKPADVGPTFSLPSQGSFVTADGRRVEVQRRRHAFAIIVEK